MYICMDVAILQNQWVRVYKLVTFQLGIYTNTPRGLTTEEVSRMAISDMSRWQ